MRITPIFGRKMGWDLTLLTFACDEHKRFYAIFPAGIFRMEEAFVMASFGKSIAKSWR